MFQQAWDNQSLTANTARMLNTSWTVPQSTAPGRYVVKIGIFAPGWTSLYAWNDAATTITVQ